MRRGRHLVIVVVFGLALSAAGCDELDLMLELFEPVDLTASDDPGEQAAGVSATEAVKLRQAERAVDEALESKDPTKLDEAVNLRPDDPRFRMYRALLELSLRGFSDAYRSDMADARSLFKRALAGVSDEELLRRWTELTLDVASRTALEGVTTAAPYCETLESYERRYGSSPEGLLYLQFANDDLCP